MDYEARKAEFDLTTPQGLGDMLGKTLTDWRNEELTDLQLDDLLELAVSQLANL